MRGVLLLLIFVALASISLTLLLIPPLPSTSSFPNLSYDWPVLMRLNRSVRWLGEGEREQKENNVTLCCHMMTIRQNHMTKLPAVLSTWLRRCDRHFIVSDVLDARLPEIVRVPNSTVGRQFLWDKSRFALRHALQEYGDVCDWFYKGDDDTFMIVERMKAFLAPFDPLVPYWSGYPYSKPFGVYMAGGSGYVMSKAALRSIVDRGLRNASICRQTADRTEDVNIGKCMSKLNVSRLESRDALGRHRFFPLSVVDMMENRSAWFAPWSLHHITGKNCCSAEPIAFHYVNPTMMKLLDYFIYRMRSMYDERNYAPR